MSNLNKFNITEATMLALAAQKGVKYRFGDEGMRCMLEYSQALLALATPPVASGVLPELPEPLQIDWPTLNSNALGCGVEDRGLHDRYECAEYGWQDGVDMAASCVPDAIYDADQMRAYGQACAAAAAPNAALVEALKDVNEIVKQVTFIGPAEPARLARKAMAVIGAALAQAVAA